MEVSNRRKTESPQIFKHGVCATKTPTLKMRAWGTRRGPSVPRYKRASPLRRLEKLFRCCIRAVLLSHSGEELLLEFGHGPRIACAVHRMIVR